MDGLTLKYYQTYGANWLYADDRFKILADEPGLGKTAQAIEFINLSKLSKRILIVCPAILVLNWVRELELWLRRDLTVRAVEGYSKPIGDANIVIISYARWHSQHYCKQLLKMKFDIGIFDEAHYLKNPKSKRAKFLIQSEKGMADKIKWVRFLTGTPVISRPIELFHVLHAFCPELLGRFNSYRSYALRYCGAFFEQVTQSRKVFNVSGASNLEELRERISEVILRRLKSDVYKELPTKILQTILLEKTTLSKRLSKMEAHRFKAIEKHSSALFSEISDIRQKLALLKVDRCADYVTDLLDGGLEKLVIFAHHKKVIEGLQEKLKVRCEVLAGGIDENKRQAAIDAFQNDPHVKIIICSIEAASVGITLTAASHVVFIESAWNPSTIVQAIDRCHRIGQKNTVLAQFIVIEGTLEAHMINTIIRKQVVVDQLVQPTQEKDIMDTTRATFLIKEIRKYCDELEQLHIGKLHKDRKEVKKKAKKEEVKIDLDLLRKKLTEVYEFCAEKGLDGVKQIGAILAVFNCTAVQQLAEVNYIDCCAEIDKFYAEHSEGEK